MSEETLKPKVTMIPASRQPVKNVGIYCRVSITHESQDESLDIQIKTLKQYVVYNPKWKLYEVYTDKDSGGNVGRPGFQKMIFDCYENRIDIVLVKTISRFARNTVDLLETVSRLKGLGIEIIFYHEDLRTSESDSDILISALSAIAQAESESTGEAIKWGLKRGFISGSSKLYSRKCFGYKHDENGELIIDEEQAEVVRMIYDLYLNGLSVILIIRELESRNIKSPQGKDTWSKRAIQTILINEKYAGHVLVGKTYSGDFPNNNQRKNDGEHEQFLMKNAHEPIIEEEKFEQVQEEIKRRSNIEIVNGKVRRKGTHYSVKREQK
ncbi:recombinase family protein [Clostridium sp.]|uniref:recombinase family protein n=1 Tax=Clostridium sp. TaxID=1506 RepID=UPI001A5E58CE|nr:recombinase family protein [Clostridium sp.]MBK5242617.1 recombinase family protein [Clostridium sp.]